MRDLEADLKICEAATRGPWITATNPPDFAFYDVITAAGKGIAPTGNEANAAFIAAARTGWPEAIKRAIKAEQALADLEGGHQ